MFKAIKKYTMALMFSGLLSVPAMAANDISENHLESELAFAFANEKISLDSSSISLLSEQELMDTEGEFGIIFFMAFIVWAGHNGYL